MPHVQVSQLLQDRWKVQESEGSDQSICAGVHTVCGEGAEGHFIKSV